MRIGIVTQPLGHNYGGILQNYALQVVLRKLGHTPYTISITDDQLKKYRWLIQDIRALINFLKGERYKFISPLKYYNDHRVQKYIYHFLRKYINRTKTYSFNPSRVVSDYGLQVLVVGSDQVWRPMYNYHIEDQFLEFAENDSVRRISYAASFGVDRWEYSEELTKKCARLIKLFHGISVREKSGVQLCDQYFGVKAEWVVDPTLLLGKKDYLPICAPMAKRSPYCFAYLLDGNSELLEKIQKEAGSRGYEVIIKSSESGMTDKDSVEQWISLILNSEMVITDSFHGTIFSLLFEKEFLTIVNNGRGASRFDSLSSILIIKDRITDSFECLPTKPLDYSVINKELECLREKSLSWLKSCLS